MLKVCHVTSVHPRYDGRIFEKECSSLANNGYDVTLFCVDNKENEIKNNVKIISKNYVYKNKLDRVFNSSKKIKKDILAIDADIYHLHDPELISLIPFLKRKNKFVIFDSHEDYPGLILEKKWLKKPIRIIASKYYKFKEKRCLKMCDSVISVSFHIVERLKKINQKTYMITNYPIYSNKKINKSFSNTICFAGGITEQWNHEKIIFSLKDIDVKYKIAGKIKDSYKDKLKKLDNFFKCELVGNLNRDAVSDLYNDSSIGMALCSDSFNVNGHGGSLGNTKLFEYMASGVPIICTDFVLWKKIIEEEKCGICVNPSDISSIHDAILKIINDDELKKKMSINGINAVKKKYNWGTQEKILLDIYKNIMSK